MDDIWTIIGVSSLIASVVTVVLGIARDVLVERYRFNRQSEAGYIQSQIQILSKIHFLLARCKKGAVGFLFKNVAESVKEVNEVIETNIQLLPPAILSEWLNLMAGINEAVEEKDPKKQKELVESANQEIGDLLKHIASFTNSYLIPKYRKIVGETVPRLPEDSIEDKPASSKTNEQVTKNTEDRLGSLFEIALVLLGVLSATETPFFIQIFGNTTALKFAITPFLFMIAVWLIKELYKNHIPLEHSLLYSEFCWEIWSLSLAYYLLFFYLYLTPKFPSIAIFFSIVTGIAMYALILGAYFLEYRKSASEYYKSRKWLLARLIIIIFGLIAVFLTFLAIPA